MHTAVRYKRYTNVSLLVLSAGISAEAIHLLLYLGVYSNTTQQLVSKLAQPNCLLHVLLACVPSKFECHTSRSVAPHVLELTHVDLMGPLPKSLEVRTDGGKEFCNAEVFNFFWAQGISHQKTVTYSPEKIGRVERINRDLLEKGRALMFHGEAPQQFWAEAVAARNRVRNVIPFETGLNSFSALS